MSAPARPPEPAGSGSQSSVLRLPGLGTETSQLPEGAIELTPEELAQYDIVDGTLEERVKKISSIFERTSMAKHQAPIWLRRFKKGDVICREGRAGTTAFYIARGEIEIGIGAPPDQHAGTTRGLGLVTGMVRRVARAVGLRRGGSKLTAADKRRSKPTYIPIDASISLAYDKRVGSLKQGEIFGEMSCLRFTPRSATCVAASTEVECLEMLRSALIYLKNNPTPFKRRLEQIYRERSLTSLLRGIDLFADVPDDFLLELREKVEFQTFEFKKDAPHPVIFREGSDPEALFIIRLGYVKVSQNRPGGEFVLRYLGPGQFFGEMGLVLGGARTATCTALDYVELLKIKKDDFDEMLRRFPAVEKRVSAVAQQRLIDEKARDRPSYTGGEHVGDFLSQRLMNAENVLVIDLDRCVRCDDCVRACAEAHDGVTRMVRDGLRFENYLVTTSCRGCTDPTCMTECPVGSIRRPTSLSIVIEDWCIGCGKCADNCPYGNINMFGAIAHQADADGKPIMDENGREKWLDWNGEPLRVAPKLDDKGNIVLDKKGKVEVYRDDKNNRRFIADDGKAREDIKNDGKGLATVCDLGEGDDQPGEPACVYACPHHAAIRVLPRDFFGQKLPVMTKGARLK